MGKIHINYTSHLMLLFLSFGLKMEKGRWDKYAFSLLVRPLVTHLRV